VNPLGKDAYYYTEILHLSIKIIMDNYAIINIILHGAPRAKPVVFCVGG
jgi:hypothetical protein